MSPAGGDAGSATDRAIADLIAADDLALVNDSSNDGDRESTDGGSFGDVVVSRDRAHVVDDGAVADRVAASADSGPVCHPIGFAGCADPWTARVCAEGTGVMERSCPDGEVCFDAAGCAPGCFIEGLAASAGVIHPQWRCYHCDPSTSTSAWSMRPPGTPCEVGLVCDPEGWCEDPLTCTESCGAHCGAGGEPERSGIHTFYYPWYGDLEHDGQWIHWAEHDLAGNWLDPGINDLTSAFFPLLGPYSSSDPLVVDQHMRWLVRAGVGVIILSWWGQSAAQHARTLQILHAAADHGMKVAFYIEPYGGGYLDTVRAVGSGGNPTGTQSPFSAAADVRFIVDLYGCHDGLYRVGGRPVFYFFAAREYQAGAQDDWRTVWDELHADPDYNPIVIAHDSDLTHRIIPGGWDGGHEYGCSWGHEAAWSALSASYAAAGKRWVASLCPGYHDARFRAEGGPETEREDGALYDRVWSFAVSTETYRPFAVAIATFNEWHEATQIEPAQPMATDLYTYLDFHDAYGVTDDEAPLAYIDRTRRWSDKFHHGAPACRQQIISDAEPGAGGTCEGSRWSGDGPGLLSCAASELPEGTVLEATYRRNTTGAANLWLADPFDLSSSVCAGYNALELRLRVDPLSAFDDGYVEIGNCRDCAAELQYRVTSDMLRDDQWTTLRLSLGGHPNFGAVDWSTVDHLRFYWSGVETAGDESEPAFRVQLDWVRIAW